MQVIGNSYKFRKESFVVKFAVQKVFVQFFIVSRYVLFFIEELATFDEAIDRYQSLEFPAMQRGGSVHIVLVLLQQLNNIIGARLVINGVPNVNTKVPSDEIAAMDRDH